MIVRAYTHMGLPGGSVVKNLPANAEAARATEYICTAGDITVRSVDLGQIFLSKCWFYYYKLCNFRPIASSL